MPDLDQLTHRIDGAAREARAIERLSAQSSLALDEAYEIQRRVIELRLSRGERVCGVKMGFTSRSKMRQMGVHEVIWGRLTDAMRIEDGGQVSLDRYIHPRVEAEVAFLLARPVSGQLSPAEAMAAVEAVAPAIELIDSRYTDFKFTHEDVVADNCSSAGFVVGAWSRPSGLSNRGVLLEIDGRVEKVGSTAAILGDPARALAAAIRLASAAGVELGAGAIVMAGAATEAVRLESSRYVRVTVEGLGAAAVSAAGAN